MDMTRVVASMPASTELRTNLENLGGLDSKNDAAGRHTGCRARNGTHTELGRDVIALFLPGIGNGQVVRRHAINTQHALGNGLTHATTTYDEYILEFVCYGVFHLALSCVIVFYLENILRNEIFAIFLA